MPNRNTLNKYEMLVTDIRRLAKKKEPELSDMKIKKIAMLIASLSSNHSWKTYRFLHKESDMDRLCMLDEAKHAFSEGWKNITESDIEEVVNSNVSEHTFSMWLYNIVEKEQRTEFKTLHQKLRMEFADGLEPIERLAD
ncbi:MAG: hypothetical protein KGH53_03845 [Candidatus Micrarchaeota archaeon]|nr:hypothetical protein [Candidatus Micrarchaeota archaeon]